MPTTAPSAIPTFLFETTEFRRHRAIFWPDWGPMTQHLGGPELRREFDLRDGAQVEFESGQPERLLVPEEEAVVVTGVIAQVQRHRERPPPVDLVEHRLNAGMVMPEGVAHS